MPVSVGAEWRRRFLVQLAYSVHYKPPECVLGRRADCRLEYLECAVLKRVQKIRLSPSQSHLHR